MSKKTKKVEKKSLTPNEKKTIIIAAICVAMAIILAVSLSLVLKPKPITPNDPGDDSNGSSTLTIKNGDFAYFDDDKDTYPKTADNWTKRTYQTPEENKTHGFDEIKDDTNVVAGVVPANEDDWETVQNDLAKQGITDAVTFPDVHVDAVDKNIYMFATKQATTAAIFSQTFSVASQVSAKITVWINAEQVKNGNAVVMLQNGSGTLKADDTEWHAYKTDIAKADGWVAYEFYIFNRKASSAVIICSVGLGNCYDGTTAEGVLFVDDITYETVSANEYRKFYDEEEDPTKTNYSIIEGETTTETVEYAKWTSDVDATYTPTEYIGLDEAKLDGEAYSPFVKDEPFSIRAISNDGKVATPKMFVLESWNGNDIVVASSEELKDHLHIGFWLRTVNVNGNAVANIILQSKDGADWKDVKNGQFTSVETSQEIDTDKNCGWVKYDVYVKPTSATETQLRLIVTLGRQEGYEGFENVYYPEGTIFVSDPIVEEISASEYKKGTGTYSKQVSLTVGNQASLQISNGSFSNYVTTNKDQPTNWTPVFAGQNEIYRDGKGDDEIANLVKTAEWVWGGIEKNDKADSANKIVGDDVEKNVLKLENKKATSHGYLSEKFTLTSKTVYALSVMAKVDSGKNPYIYVVKDNPENRTDDAFLGKIEKAADVANVADDNKFGNPFFQENLGNGWVRYYMIIVTGDESVSARLALFNGSIDGSAMQEGTVYYDMASWNVLGSYTVNTDKDAEVENKRDRIEFTATKGYKTFEELSDEELTAVIAESNVVSNATDWDWENIVDEAMKEPEEKPEEPAAEPENEPVNLGLLFGLLSSVALVGALLIVVVVKLFKKRNRA